MRLIVGITGSTGVVYGIRLLEVLRDLKIETHLIMSDWAKKCIPLETNKTIEYVASLATQSSENTNMASSVSSGTSLTDGMIIAPCSMKTLASIACGYDETLVARAAGVTIKESRKLVIMARETPLSAIHLENMLKLARIGVIILPPVAAFYGKPATVDDMVDHGVGKCLDQFSLDHKLYRRWGQS